MDKLAERQALVFFIEDEVEDPDQALEDQALPRTPGDRVQLVGQMQGEIQRLREQLQITTEEYDSSNEEMKAANEELQSINEEYRSTTEELETSKEELQTVNTEMRNKLDDISQAHKELENLMGSTDIATLYLDRELRIQRFTAGIQKLFNIINSDRGRRISDLTHKMENDQFLEDAERVLRTLIPAEREFMREDGHWFLMRLRPYRTIEDRIEGVVITFIDVSQLKATEQELVGAKESLEERVRERTGELDDANIKLTKARDMFYALFNANPIPASLTRLEDDVILDVNEEFLNYFGLQRRDVIGQKGTQLNIGGGEKGFSREELIDQVRKDGKIKNYEGEIRLPSGEIRNLLGSIQVIHLDEQEALISTFIDITERVRAEREIRSLASDLTIAEQKERQRISQILHDDLQQRIFAVKVQLSTFSDDISTQNISGRQVDIEQLQKQLDEAISITRDLSINLSPAILQGDSLADALVWLSQQMHERYGLNVRIESNGVSTRFEDTLRILLFQTVREALFNVVKHAGILNATVFFEQTDGQIRLTISDEGSGFDSDSDTDGQGGLLNLRHRLELMGCKLEINSSPGTGTQVIINIPNRQAK